jgi:ribosomal-protein-alanine N-acetyltransferase
MSMLHNEGDEPTGSLPPPSPETLRRAWRTLPPTLRGRGVVLREVEPDDAEPLLALLAREEVVRVSAPGPAGLDDLARLIGEARVERADGRGLCLACVPESARTPAGLFRLRRLEPQFSSTEWEFVIAPEHWGRGLFFSAAPLVIDFVFDVLQANRLEARAAVHNGRGAGALRKLGAVQEAVLRDSMPQPGGWADQTLWTILADDWRARTGRRGVH